MRTEFVAAKSPKQARKLCPWACKVAKVEGGYKCFESWADYDTWQNQASRKATGEKKKTYTVTLHETKTNGQTWTSRHRASESVAPWENPLELQLIEKAVKKHFGATAFFHEDSGLHGMSRKYGQVFKPVQQKSCAGNSSVTGRLYADIQEG